MGRKRLNKPKPREMNHDFLQEKYAEAETTPQQKVMKTIILNLYQSGFIRTKKVAENLINKYLVSAKNKQRQNKQFRNQMIKYISKSPIKLNNIIEKGDKAAEEVETKNLIKSVSIIDSNKPFTK
jgi:phenylacetate-coenzyme A ligase PaaK-like adenylate-forming protein